MKKQPINSTKKSSARSFRNAEQYFQRVRFMQNMFYQEKERKIPIAAQTDILIAGGGPAGIGAAIGAAKAGAQKIILLESLNALGGMAGPGMMSHWVGVTGSPEVALIQKKCINLLKMPDIGDWFTPIHHESLKYVLQEYLLSLGVQIQYNVLAVAAIKDGSTLRGVITESKSGREAILAKVTIDATGDGDIAAAAGADFELGRPEDHACQPATLMFRIGGVDYNRAIFPGSFETKIDVPAGEIQDLARKHLTPPAGHTLLYKTLLPGEVCVNMTNVINVNGTDTRSVTEALIQCRRQMLQIVDFLRKFAPGYENCYPVTSGDLIGIRETRHFKTQYEMTAEDITEGRLFPDWITTGNAFNFDIHNVKGSGLDENGAQKHFKSKGRYSIPLRACIPIGTNGLLLAGRCIGGSHKAHSNYRAMPICLGIGQGAGVAAAFAAENNGDTNNLDITKIQQELQKQGIPDHN